MVNVSQYLQENTLTGVSFLINISCRMQLKLIIIQKEVPTLVFSWHLSEILTTTFLKKEKKHCYKKRGSDIYRKSNYASFDLTSPRFLLLRDVFETSQRSHGKYIFFEICSRCLKDVTEKTYFLRCIWDVLKMSQKSHLLWDVSKSSPRCLSQWRSDWDLSETSHAYWVRDSSRTRSRYFTCF